MNTKTLNLILTLALFAGAHSALAQGTAFTYQGRLNSGGTAATGSYDFRFKLYADALGNTQVGSSYVTNAIGVTNGLFLTTIDFGAGIFTGASFWLEVDVKTNGGTSYSVLTPLQAMAPTPYALFATTASNVSGTVSAAQISGGMIGNAVLPPSPIFSGAVAAGSFAGNGANVTNVNAATLNGLNAGNFWQLGGNNVGAGQFIGSMNNQPVEIWVNSNCVLRLEYATNSSAWVAPNVIAGYSGNAVARGFIGATIAGGGITNFPNLVSNNWASVLGGYKNLASGEAAMASGKYSTASGDDSMAMGYNTKATGLCNVAMGNATTASGLNASVAMGFGTTASGDMGSVAMGASTIASGASSVAMGNYTTASGDYSTAMGYLTKASGRVSTALGYSTTASRDYATALGYNTTASGAYSTALGCITTASGDYSAALGQRAQAVHQGVFVWADSQNALFTSTTNDQFLIRAQGGVGIGTNVTTGTALTVAGSVVVENASQFSVSATNVAMGNSVAASGNYAAALGYKAQALHQGAFVWADSQSATFASTANDQFCVRAQGGAQLDASTSLYFGSLTRQMINLYGTSYGLGVQSGTVYERSPTRFSWFQGGIHSNTQNDPGTGGTVLMTLISSGLTVAGTVTANGVLLTSDRNAKENFAPLNPQAVLAKVTALPVTEWNYKSDDAAQKHIGPMAQDFQAAFQLSADDKHISVVDEGGVALAAIQGLNEKLTEKDAKINELEKRLNQLERTLQSLTDKK